MNGFMASKSTVSFGPVPRMAHIADDLQTPNSNSTIEQAGISSGLIFHDVWTTVQYNFATTVANTNVSVTLTSGPRPYVIVYNPSATAIVYVNFNSTAVAPVAGVTAGSFPLLQGSFLQIGFLVTTVQVISATASIDVHITSYK